MPSTNRKQLHERLWSAAVQLRANSGLKLNEISEPILGLIFLKFADVRFKRAKLEIQNERKSIKSSHRQPPITPDHYKSKGVLYLPEIAAYFVAALAGGIFGITLIKHKTKDLDFWDGVRDSINLIVLALAFLVVGVILEVFVTPKLF